MSEDRSTRVFPLAAKIMELLATEDDKEVRIVAFDVAKVAVDHQRMMLKSRPINALRKKVFETLEAHSG